MSRKYGASKRGKEDNARSTNRPGYFMEDIDCRDCRYYQGKKRGCKLDKCCCEDEKLESIASGRVKRKQEAMAWPG